MYRVCETLRHTSGPDGAIVLDIVKGRIFSLNPVASRILQLLQTGREESEIATEISEVFHVGDEVAARDIREFIQDLETRRLIEQVK